MIRERKKWMSYTYYHRTPCFHFTKTHLFSPVRKKIFGMVCVPFPTMLTDIRECDFVQTWSKSTRYKINKAGQDQLRLVRGRQVLGEILTLFVNTARSKGLRGHHEYDFHSRPWIFCSAVYSDDQILAGHIWIIDEEEKKSLLFVNAASHLDEESEGSLVSRAHYYLLWADGMHLRNHGIDYLDLNGYDPSSRDPALSGVFQWKSGTHGTHEQLFHYYPFWFYWFRKLRKQIP